MALEPLPPLPRALACLLLKSASCWGWAGVRGPGQTGGWEELIVSFWVSQLPLAPPRPAPPDSLLGTHHLVPVIRLEACSRPETRWPEVHFGP